FGSRGGEAKGRRRHEASRRGMGEARASRAAALSQEAGAVVPSAAGFRRPRSPDCRTSGAPEVFPPPWSPPDRMVRNSPQGEGDREGGAGGLGGAAGGGQTGRGVARRRERQAAGAGAGCPGAGGAAADARSTT